MNAPEYKVGDKVTVRSKYHINCKSSDYACSFTEGMRATFGGNLCTIDSIYLVDKVDAFGNHRKAYTLREDPAKLLYTAYMFEESGTPQAFIDKLVKEELEKPFNGMLKDIPEKVVEEMLREQYRQTDNIDKSVFEVDIRANSHNKGFDWGLSLRGFPFWDSIISRRMYDLLYEDTDRKIPKEVENLINKQVSSGYSGQLESFPPEIVTVMLEEQYLQGNPVDIRVFENNCKVNKRLKGFNWAETRDPKVSWSDILYYRDFSSFYRVEDTKDETIDNHSQKLDINIILLNTPKSKNRFNLIKNIYEKN